MYITILVFGELKKRINSDRLTISTDLPISAVELLKLVESLKPELGYLLKYCSLATNGELANTQTLIQANEEVALLPPVSGG